MRRESLRRNRSGQGRGPSRKTLQANATDPQPSQAMITQYCLSVNIYYIVFLFEWRVDVRREKEKSDPPFAKSAKGRPPKIVSEIKGVPPACAA